MSPQKSTYLALFIAILAIFASTNLIKPNPQLLRNFTNSIVTTFINFPTKLAFSKVVIEGRHDHQPHKKRRPEKKNSTGCCNFTTVQAAIDAIPDFSPKKTIIWINNGIYYEKVNVPRTKPNITFQGQGYTSTAIAWNDTANSAHGTFYSGSVQVFAEKFIAKNISFMNVAPIPSPGDMGAQAVAIRIAGDQAAFWGCGFFGAQDTLHDDRGRHYFKDCYIQGSIDFIFGNGRSFYENCQLLSMANPVAPGQRSINGAVTAHGRVSKGENTGFVFINCLIGGNGRVWLGRAWRPFSRVVFINTTMSDIIAPEGWNDFNDPTRDQTIFYGEYNCSGTGASMTLRAPYVQRLNDILVSPFLTVSFIDGDQWLQPYN
ncbi:Pectinesterase [Quillaja saponaria]|uniref:Pectinesterase n=1 Tax=Quillaja saponaria TaxID=32244 RepID=A0AAD7LUN8_QUISA|nr:Pectinesterase [Quillaja saponaria]